MPNTSITSLKRMACGALLSCALSLLSLAPVLAAAGPSGAEELALWPGAAPGSESATAKQEVIERSKDPAVKDRAVVGIVRPTLEIWKPERPNGTAVVVLPGGAYQRVVVDKKASRWGSACPRTGSPSLC
jgi:hypothetical protein